MPSIKILFFAAARELVGGVQQVDVEIQPRADSSGVLYLRDVRTYLASAFPDLDSIIADVTLALNMQYVGVEAEGTLSLQDGDEVALIPPISGG